MVYESVGDFILRATPAEKEAMAKALSSFKPPAPLNLAQHFDPEHTDKNTIHSYLPEYERLLQHIVSEAKYGGDTLTLMEVGIQRGGSIVGWLKAFPNARVVGVDCQKTVTINVPGDRYKELITNAYTDEFVSSFNPGTFDVIIDDGSHAYNDILFACRHYTKLLKPGGILIIEDVPDISWVPKFQKVLPADVYSELLDLRSKKGRWDDMLLVITKKHA